jgi:para-aminobenzoate synthetase/4-amino-4-deoxychorismate lyase
VKSRFLHTVPVEFQFIESMLLEDGEYFLLARHLERLKSSAEYFGFRFPEDEINSALPRIAKGSFKVRLQLGKDGQIEMQILRIEKADLVRGVALAVSPVDSSDRFLYHKTTRRDYKSEDVIFWNERGEVTESRVANVVVMIDGQLFTPPVNSGLLPGTFREQLLAEGKIKERVIKIEELKKTKELFLINSVRKWMRVKLIEQDL